ARWSHRGHPRGGRHRGGGHPGRVAGHHPGAGAGRQGHRADPGGCRPGGSDVSSHPRHRARPRRLRDALGHPLATSRSLDTPREVAPTAPGTATLEHVRVAIVTESFLPALNGVTTSVCKVLENLQASGDQALVIAPGTTPWAET